MGGGGAIRAAAKIAGLNSGIRNISPGNQPISAAARRASATRPAEEVTWTGLSSTNSSNGNPIDAAAVQRPCWEMDDWEFAGGEADTAVVSGEPLPRLVFGGAPSLEEAKAATNELKDALDKIYLSSPNPIAYQEEDQNSSLSLISKQEYLETKACVVSEDTTKSLPNNALKAFRLLNENSAAQSVVASIASDPNVWNAVLQNVALSEFLQSQKAAAPFPDTDSIMDDVVSDKNPTSGTSKSSFNSYEKSSNSGNWFVDFMETLKNSVLGMKNGLAEYFQNLFGSNPVEVTDGTDTSDGASFMKGSFIGLAVMVIMLVVLKRP